ncbi:MAG TPA: hypothetical protein VEW42_06560 [Candidatus Eisenbacteria bacterium]|nr:hypothetical protein [Candidatus Eisenbacteria bacterium]
MVKGVPVGSRVRLKYGGIYDGLELTVVGRRLIELSRSEDGKHRLYGFDYTLGGSSGNDARNGNDATEFEVISTPQRKK